MKPSKALAVLSCLALPLSAAPDSVDPAFAASAGQVFQANAYGGVASVLVQPDGKVLFGSNEMPGTVAGSPLQLPLIRVNPDGSVDNTFFADNDANGSGSGIYYDSAGWPEVHALGLLSDGKIVAAGVMQGVRTGTTAAPGTFLHSNSIVRFNADGTIDTSFQTNGTTPWPTGGFNYIEDVTIQPDDKTIAVGGFGGFRNTQSSPTITRYGIARLNVDGSVDTGFQLDPTEFGVPGGAANVRGYFAQASVDPSGKIYVAGDFEWGPAYPPAGTIRVLARLFPNGGRDYSFNPTLPANLDSLRGVIVEPDGKVVAMGTYTSPATTSWMTRLNPDGTAAGSFTLDPSLGTVSSRPLQRDPAGKFLVASGDTLKRLNADGSLDATFSATSVWTNHPGGTPQAGYFGSFTTAPDGKIFSGSAYDSVNGVSTVKLAAFEGDAVAAGLAWKFTAPSVTENAGSITLQVVRSGPSAGSASVSFATSPGSAGASDFTATTGTLSWAAGETGAKFLTIPITQDTDSEGSESFTVILSGASGASVSGPASVTVTILDDEALPVIVTPPAALTVKEGQPAAFSVAISSPVSATFQWRKNGMDIPGATASSYAIPTTSLASAADYSVVVTTPAGSVESAAARLTVLPPAAKVDPTFSFSGVTKTGGFAMLTDGSTLILDGDSLNGYTLRKLNASFQVDPSFVVTTVPSSGVSATSAYPRPIALPDGRFLVEGFFSQVNGVNRLYLARLDANGTVDPTFVPFFNGPFQINGFNTSISAFTGVAVTPSGKVYVMIRSASQGARLFRMTDDGSIDTSFAHNFNYSTNASLATLTELSDGSILIGYSAGGFGSFERGFRRILPDGTFDPAFPRYNTANVVNGLIPLDTSRLAAIHGNLLTIHSLQTGALLETFTFGGQVTSMQPFRGRHLLTGVTSFGSVTLPGLALFHLNGTVDDNFPGGAGPNANVVQAYVDSQDRILVRGGFTIWNGASTPGLTRLVVDRPEIAFDAAAITHLENAGPLTVTLKRYGNAAAATSVRITTAPGTATAPADFAAIDQVLTWAAGDATPKSVSFVPTDDTDLEGDESLTLQLTEAIGATPVSSSLPITLRDDDSMPRITAQPAEAFAVLGKSASFAVTATSPTTATYQWYLNGVAISGATSATHSISSVAAASEGTYTVRIANAYATVESAAAKLIIVPDPTLLATGFTATQLTGTVYALAPAPDGGVYVGGFFTNVGGDPNRDYLVKLTATGALDTSFTPPVLNGGVRDLALQPDGKLIAAGQFSSVAGSTLRRIVRLETTGAIDTAFAGAVGAGPNGDVSALELEPDGRIVVGGSFSTWNNLPLGGKDDLLRLNADGSIATNVHTDYGTVISDVQRLPDGDLLVAYNTTSSSAAKVRRFNPDLTLDASFTYGTGRTRVDRMTLAADGHFLFAGVNGLFKVDAAGDIVTTFANTSMLAVARQVNGKILAGGTSGARMFRYLPDATADPSFSFATIPNGQVQAIALLGDGKFWMGGAFTQVNGVTVNFLALLNGDPIPLAITTQPQALTVVDPDEDVALTVGATGMTALSYQWRKNGTPLADGAGISGSQTAALTLTGVDAADGADYTVAVTNAAGTVTSAIAKVIVLGTPQILSISEGVTQLEGYPLTLEVEALGAGTLSYQWYRGATLLPSQTSATLQIPATAETDSGNYTVVVTNTLGSATSDPIAVVIQPNEAALAPGFVPPTVNGLVRTILPLEDGNVLIGGDFLAASDGANSSGNRLAVISKTGAIVPVPGLSADGSVYALRRTAAGKILVAGDFRNVNGSPRVKTARLNADLSLDTTYDPGAISIYTGLVMDIAEEASGTILLAGQFYDYAGIPTADYAVRVSDTGAPLTTFTSSANSYIYRVLPQPDGKAIFIGWFTWTGGNSYIVRTNPDGTADGTAYNVGFFFGGEGLDLGGGGFLASNGVVGGVYRFDGSGTGDTTFLSQGAPNGVVSALIRDSAGRLLLGGNFTAIAGTNPHNRLVRLNTDGTRDTGFAIGSGFDNAIEDLAIASDGAIWAGGNFTSYNGLTVSRLVRLKGGSSTTPPTDPYQTFVGPLPEADRDPGSDPDGDGFPNLAEFVFGTDPASGSATPPALPTGTALTGAALNAAHGLALDPAKHYRVLEIELPSDLRGVSVAVEAGLDLGFTGDATATEVGPPVDHGATRTHRYVITPAHDDAPRLFWRLRFTR